MKKIVIKTSLLAIVAVMAVVLTLPVTALAQNARAQEVRQNSDEDMSTTQVQDDRRETAQERASERRELAQTKLADAKLRACENRQKSITNIMSRIADRGEKQIELFGTIADRTMAFYEDKGISLANYDELVADVEAKQVAAETVMTEISETVVEFDCTAEDPKGMASNFKDSLRSQRDALKEYKTSVRNLIVGVKSAQSADSTEGEVENE